MRYIGAYSRMMAITLVVFTMVSQADAATNLQPVMLASRGTVTSGEHPVESKKGIPLGSIVKTGPGSRAVLAIAPGLMITLRENTSIKLIASHVDQQGGVETRAGEVEIIEGKVTCAIQKEKTAKHKFKLHTGKGESVEAVGTSWTTSKDQEKTQTTVTTGTVQWTSPSGVSVSLPSGKVLVTTTNAEGGEAAPPVVVDLVTGTVTTIGADGEATSSPATPAQLATASQAFAEAVASVPAATLSAAEVSSISSLVNDVNKTLESAGLAKIETSNIPQDAVAAEATQPASTASSNNPADTTSSTTPQ